MTSKKFKLPLTAIKETFFVRAKLDEDWILQLAQLIENRQELPPIEVTKDHELVDGRHRIEAYKLNNRTEIECVLVEETDRLKLVALAFTANVGGSKPPTQEDIKFTIRTLLRDGVSRRKIIEMMPFPKEVTRRYVDDVQSAEAKQRMNQAVDAVVEGEMTVKDAAEKLAVDPIKLKETLKGKKKTVKSGRSLVAQYKTIFTVQFRRLSLSNGKHMGNLVEKYRDGLVTHAEMQELYDHLGGLMEQMKRAHAGRVKRFQAAVKSTEIEDEK